MRTDESEGERCVQLPLGFAEVAASPPRRKLFGKPLGMNSWKGKVRGLLFFLAGTGSAGADVAWACPPGIGMNAEMVSGFSRFAGLKPNGEPLLLLLLPPKNDVGSNGKF
jgi:hypothetical protein